MNFKKICSALMLLVITSQIFASTILTASEIVSEIKNSDIDIKEVVSEDSINEEKVIDKTTKTTSSDRVPRGISYFQDLGNQNTSPIGLATYMHPNEETDDSIKTFKEMQEVNGKYVAVEDLEANLVIEAVRGLDMSEGLLPIEYDLRQDTDELNKMLFDKQTWSGNCWNGIYAGNKMSVKTKVSHEDECDYFMKDYAYYYNIKTEEYYPVDIQITIDYVDFKRDKSTDLFALGYEAGKKTYGLYFVTNVVDELEYTIKILNQDGQELQIPVVYRYADIDMGSSLAVENDNLVKAVAYFQDPLTSLVGDYNHEENDSVFNYVSMYEKYSEMFNSGTLGITDKTFRQYMAYNAGFDRSEFNDHPSIDNGNGQYTPEERGWNRLKIVDSGNYVNFIDSWGTPSEYASNYVPMTNGKDSELVVVTKPNGTYTSNMLDVFYGINTVNEGPLAQTYGVNPYRAMARTVVNKSVTDHDNEIAEVGDTLNYAIEVTNVSQVVTEFDVVVRDSMLENLPSYLSWDGTIMIDGVETVLDPNNVEIILPEVAPMTKVTIEYKIVVDSIPNDVTSISNIVTNNGDEPVDICTPETFTFECDATETPVNAPTVISKKVTDSSGNGRAENGEKLSYTIEITNPNSNADATDVVVRDSLLENLPSYLTWDGNFTVDPTTVYTGDLATGDFTLETVTANSTVSITYDLLVGIIPTDVAQVVNVVTDNGLDPTDPDSCANADDCGEATIDLDGETKITKSVVDEDGNGLVAVGEKLNYIIEVSNTTGNHAYDVAVRDSMLENLPEYVTFNEDVEINGSEFSGSLTEGTLVLDKVLASETVTITYSMTVNDIPKGVVTFLNVVTDNGEDPTTVDPEVCDEVDCSAATIDVDSADTIIEKSVVDSDGSGLLASGETLTYTIKVSNPNGNHAYDVNVRDDMLEKVPSFATFNNDVKITGSEFTGSLTEGTLQLDSVKAGEVVSIVYSLTINKLPTNTSEVINVVTDNGEDPSKIDSKTCEDSTDCASASIALIEIAITKTIVETGNKVIAIIISSILTLTALLFAKRQVNEKL